MVSIRRGTPTTFLRPPKRAPNVILVPKVSSAETLELIGRRLLDMGTDHKTRVWAMIETPLAIFNVLSIAGAAPVILKHAFPAS